MCLNLPYSAYATHHLNLTLITAAWSGVIVAKRTLSNRLQKLQNRAAQVITSSGFETDVDSLFHKLSWKDLQFQCQIPKALMVFKSLNGLVPEYLTSKFLTQNESNYALRDLNNKLVVPFPRTNYMKNSFSYSGATLWNSLPCNYGIRFISRMLL